MELQALNNEIKHIRSQYLGQLEGYKVKVDTLEETVIQLEGANKRLRIQVEQLRSQKGRENGLEDQRIKEVQLLLKAREDDLYSKECQILKLQQTIESLERKIAEDSVNSSKTKAEYQTLLECYQSQQKQLQDHLSLNEELVSFTETYVVPNEVIIQQKAILVEFNKELQTQIIQLQDTNQSLLTRTQNYQAMITELKLQNTQNNDLASLAERILESYELAAR